MSSSTWSTRSASSTESASRIAGAAGAVLPPQRSRAALTWPRRMHNPVRDYDWGSRHVLATLQGRELPDHPEAELWMGAHPSAPSAIEGPAGRLSLLEVIDRNPRAVLGTPCHDAFGPRLPYLLKVLAVERALSIQVHPDPEQARRGHEREREAGVPAGDPSRVYPDPHPKPELLHAVTPFEALAGLRAPASAAALLALLDGDRVRAVARRLGAAEHVVDALAALATWPAGDRAALAAEAASAARRALAVAEHGPAGSSQGLEADGRRALGWVLRLAEQHAEDPMVLAPLLLHVHRLDPGGTLFVPAGVPHAYLSGVGVEIMAASDNVVRAGLTSKHVDREALLELLDPSAAPVRDLAPVPLGPHEHAVRPPVPAFQLTRVRLDGSAPLCGSVDGPQVVLCLAGSLELTAGGRTVELTGGTSAFVGAGAGELRLTGAGEAFRAAPGPLAPS